MTLDIRPDIERSKRNENGLLTKGGNQVHDISLTIYLKTSLKCIAI